jgi:hypothetical protein
MKIVFRKDIICAAVAPLMSGVSTKMTLAATEGILIEASLPAFDFSLTSEQIEAALPRWENNGSVKNTRADVTTDTIATALTSLFA